MVEKIESLLTEMEFYCSEKHPAGALLLTGEWGGGKTYFVVNRLQPHLKDSHIFIRISLFGIKSVNELQASIKKKWIECIADYIAMSKIDVGATSKVFNALKPFAKACVDTFIDTSVPEGKQGIAKSLFSISADQLITITNEINGKIIVLVFDDLERSSIPFGELLGCINEYVENQHFHTIIIANENTIKKRENEHSGASETLKYNEIKEKVVERQLEFQNDPLEIVSALIESESAYVAYHSFLVPLKDKIVELFSCDREKSDRPRNVRSLKVAIRSFRRVYDKLVEFGIEPGCEPRWLYSFIAYTMVYKTGSLTQDDGIWNPLDSSIVKDMYPGFYSSDFLFPSIRVWICTGFWDEEQLKSDCTLYLKKQEATSAYDMVRLYNIFQLEDEIIERGWPEVESAAYSGKLSLDDYVIFVGNYEWMISNKYPIGLMDWTNLQTGINKRIELSREAKEAFGKIRMWPTERITQYSPEAQASLMLIKAFFDSPRFLYANNENAYISTIKTDCFSALQIVENKIMAAFTDEMAEATTEAFKALSNMEKSEFQGQFKKLWLNESNFPDFDVLDSVSGFENMKKSLEVYLDQCQKASKYMAAIITRQLVQGLDSILEKIKSKDAKKEISQ